MSAPVNTPGEEERAVIRAAVTLPFMRRRVPRAVNIIAQAVAFPAFFVGVPLELSRLDKRHGWSDGRPGPVNLVGLLPLGAGAALLLWAMSSHYRAAPQGWEIRIAPDYLLRGGPYRYSRNPMYVGEAAIWAGWAVLLGSPPVAGGLAMPDDDPGRRSAPGGERAAQAVGQRVRRQPGAGSTVDHAACSGHARDRTSRSDPPLHAGRPVAARRSGGRRRCCLQRFGFRGRG